jgi:hypothetical protein
MLPAIETLARAARGEEVFHTPEQMRSCFTLARLAQSVLLDASRAHARAAQQLRDEYDNLPDGFKEPLTDQQREWLHIIENDHGPTTPGCGFLEDPNKKQKWFSWQESHRRAGLDPMCQATL